MKSKKFLSIMAIVAMMFVAPQHVNAQFWKQLGKAAEKLGKAVLESPTTQSTETQSTTSTQSTQSSSSNSPRYKIHRTADTKTITLRDGVAFMGMFSEGHAVVSQKNRDNIIDRNKAWFVINEKGEKVFNLPEDYKPSQYDIYSDKLSKVRFNSGRLLIEKNVRFTKEVSIIDTLGNVIKTFNDVVSASQFNDGVAILSFYNGNPWLVDINGNIITKSISLDKNEDYYWIGEISDGLRYFKDKTTGKYGYLDDKCNIVISPKFKNCHDFSEGLAAVKNDEGLWGFIDKTGKYVIDPIFSNEPSSFYSGYAKVEDKSRQYHFIDKTGRIVWTPNYTIFHSGGFSKNGYLVAKGVILNTSFKEVVRNSGIIYASRYYDEYFIGNGSVYDYNGNLLLEYDSERGFFRNGFGSYDNGEQYYFNLKGEIIVEFKDTQF